MITKFRNAVVLFSLWILLASCSGNRLDRDKAEDIIVDYFKYPNIEYIELPSVFYCLKLDVWSQACLERGLIFMRDSYFSRNQNCWNYDYAPEYDYAKYHLFTKESDRENTNFVNGYLTGVRHFKEVTGIKFSNEDTKAVVEFTVMREKVTPFGKAIGRSNGIVTYTTTLELYDDGWRVAEKYNSFPYDPEKYSFLE